MKKKEALEQLDKYDSIGRKILSIYDDEVPDFVVRGLKEEHKRSMEPTSRFIFGGKKLINLLEKSTPVEK